MVGILVSKVEIVSHDKLSPHWEAARKIIEKIDPDDDVFIACALAHPGSVIWSDDKRLKQQKEIEILNTPEFARQFI